MLLFWLWLTVAEFDIVVSQDVCDNYLHLATRKEAPGASPDAVAEVDIVGARGYVLVLEFATRLLAQSGEPEGIELGGVWVQIRVHVERMGTNHDAGSPGQIMAGWQHKTTAAGDDPRHVCCGLGWKS